MSDQIDLEEKKGGYCQTHKMPVTELYDGFFECEGCFCEYYDQPYD
jgi:hypothetical protein